jgi:hypothetical protein
LPIAQRVGRVGGDDVEVGWDIGEGQGFPVSFSRVEDCGPGGAHVLGLFAKGRRDVVGLDAEPEGAFGCGDRADGVGGSVAAALLVDGLEVRRVHWHRGEAASSVPTLGDWHAR